MRRILFPLLLAAAAIGWVVFTELQNEGFVSAPAEPVAPNWASITAWPGASSGLVQATPDPNRRITVIVLDDSGSMASDMTAAKGAVLGTLDAMADTDRVAVVALNAGIVLPFADVAEARQTLPAALRPIQDTGTTPLTGAMRQARLLLEAEASQSRSFGTYRMIVTTDGAADDPQSLTAEVTNLAAATPIQLTTIGIDIGGRHVLRRSDLGSFVDVSNVDALQGALQAAVAENTDFTAITDFSED
ncbi:MAG: vWA domain-containing protein [Pseudomonadota bacterium]